MSVSIPSGHAAAQPLAETGFTKRLERRVLRFIQQRRIFSPGERVVVAVSGGPDSSALLVILRRLSENLDIDITAAHFDHKLRSSEESVADLKFAEDISASLAVALVSDAGDTRAHRGRASVEDAARRLRYSFLARASEQVGASAVAAGHTLDDQAETVLLHLLRGSGLDGISGMRARAPWPFGSGPDLARALLCLRREDTERYCRDLGIEPRRDPSNHLPIATRNRIRLQLLPALKEFNPRVAESLARLAAAAAQDTDFIAVAADQAWQQFAQLQSKSVSFSRDQISCLHPALLGRLIRRAVAHVSGSDADLEGVHIEDVLAALSSKHHHRMSLPHGLIAVLDSRSLSIVRGEALSAQMIPEIRLALPGRTTVAEWIIETALVPCPANPRTASPLEAYLDADAVGENLSVRSRQQGDRLQPLGLRGEKKVQDILVDAKVPAAARDVVPLICSSSGIAWVVGHCLDGRYALRADSKQAVRLACIRLTAEN